MVWHQRGRAAIMDPTLENEAPVNLLADVVKVMLLKTTASPSATTWDHLSDLPGGSPSGEEIVATGYTAYGAALASKALNRDDANTRIEFDAADRTFSSIGGATNDTFDKMLIFREPDTGAADSNRLILASLSCAATLTNGGDITLQWDTEGILQFA